MSDELINQFLGSYKGVAVRSKKLKTQILINSADIFKANHSRSKFRFDKWRGRDDIQKLLEKKAKKSKVEPLRNREGLIIELQGVIEVIRGGDRRFQGTYISPEMAKLYTLSISDDCHQWFNELFNDGQTGEAIKAKRVSIQLGNIKIDVYEIPNGEYRLSQTQVERISDSGRNSFSDFLTSKSPEALPYKGFRFQKMVTSDENNVRLKAVPIPIAVAYWTKESIKGNQNAARLLGACAIESIERRADKAFGKIVCEKEYNQRFQDNYQSIIADCPQSFVTKQKTGLNVSVYQGDGRRLSKLYPQGVIPGFSKKQRIIERIVYLSSHAKDEAWKLKPRQELPQLGKATKSKYPDIMSGVININNIKSVFIFQVYEDIIRPQDIESCIARRYTRLSTKLFKVNYSFLFLVAPLGATITANEIIQDEIETGENQSYNFTGVMTIKDLANFYYQQALPDKKSPKNIGGIKKDFKPFMEYKIYSSIDQVVQLTLPFVSAS